MSQKNSKQTNTPLAHRICDRLDLPEEVCRNCSKIEIISNCCAMVDGCKSVKEYNDSRICLCLGKNCVEFRGTDLSIRSLSQQQAVVEGYIISVEFCGG